MIVDRKELVKALNRVKPALGINVLVPTFQCFIFQNDRVVATDGTMIIKASCPDLQATFAIPGLSFLFLLESLSSDTIELELEDTRVLIKDKKIVGTFTLAQLSSIPQLLVCENMQEVSLELYEGFQFCQYSVSKDSSVGPLCGVRVDGKDMFSTDRYRIANFTAKENLLANPCTLPIKLVQTILSFKKEIMKIGLIEDNQIVIEMNDGTILSSVLLRGEYKNLLQFIPPQETIVDNLDFPASLNEILDRHITLLKNIQTLDKEIRVVVEGTKCIFTSVDKDLGKLEEEVELTNPVKQRIEFSVNPLFLKEIAPICNSLTYTTKGAILFVTEKLIYVVIEKQPKL